jgi:hypothetical protein
MPGINGSGRSSGKDFAHFPSRGFDISRSSLPLAVALALSVAMGGAAFQVGRLFSSYETERGEILKRLDLIEGALVKLATSSVNKPLRKSRESDRG